MTLDERARQIAHANDLLRRTCAGSYLKISSGVSALPPKVIADALMQMRAYDKFTPQNDPYREHDFGSFRADGHEFYFRIDALNATLTGPAPDPFAADTKRICTLMLSSEY
jgi:hypothetical protein